MQNGRQIEIPPSLSRMRPADRRAAADARPRRSAPSHLDQSIRSGPPSPPPPPRPRPRAGTARARRNRPRRARRPPPRPHAAAAAPATYRRRRRQIRTPRFRANRTHLLPRLASPCFAAAAALPAGDVIATSRWAWAGSGPVVGPACLLAACVGPFFSFFPCFSIFRFNYIYQEKKLKNQNSHFKFPGTFSKNI